MARKAFYSFHYKADNNRASQIRNMGVIEGNRTVTDNNWEKIKRGGDKAIQNWIDSQLHGKSCTVVLIGSNTAGRKWINYEIEKSWNDGKGLLGIYVHNLKNLQGNKEEKGDNPFDNFTMKRNNAKLSSIVKAINPPSKDSKKVYAYIQDNLLDWIEEAIEIRKKY
ncbi:hypothetical protein E3U55_15755 [Filobacillus milosensis]|uniref:Thoeris protein ThsB TIR-like domain-containing protein n=1 Tax=Filobacillus milosensis TaxID=94137 RepID=A0A4Y8ICD8_9BACI|nr:TIR domain-containing protein [Filobacillus milosensis]TFB13574.1 hypothetical protein E3U55_15755 [Filobacillus milosensis]